MSVPKEVGPGKFYLPAFNIVCTVPTFDAACALEQGVLELIQYRGNSVACFNVAMGRNATDSTDPLLAKIDHPCFVAMATYKQLFASVMCVGEADGDTLEGLAAASEPSLEPWEVRHVAAAAAFIRFDYERCTALCIEAIEIEPFDPFTARLLLITTYLGSDQDALCDGFGAVVAAYEMAMAKGSQTERMWNGVACGEHAMHLSFALWMGWAAFGLEESRRDVQGAEDLARRAVQHTIDINARYDFHDQHRRGALAAAAPGFGFTCVFPIHVVMHCYEARGDPRGALKALESWDQRLWIKADHLADHVRWHVATFLLESGEAAAAVAYFLKHLAKPNGGDPYALSDTIAFAWRYWMTANYFHNTSAVAWFAESADTAGTSIAAVAREVEQKWSAFEEAKLSKVPFFYLHRRVASVLAAWCTTPTADGAGSTWQLWVVDDVNTAASACEVTPPKPLPATPAQRRAALCDAVLEAATLMKDKEQLPAALRSFCSIATDFSAAATRSVYGCALHAAAPMGGSVAQQRLISLTAFLICLLLKQPGAHVALRSLARGHPHSAYVQALESAAAAAATV